MKCVPTIQCHCASCLLLHMYCFDIVRRLLSQLLVTLLNSVLVLHQVACQYFQFSISGACALLSLTGQCLTLLESRKKI